MNNDLNICARDSPNRRRWTRLATVASSGLVALSSSSQATPNEPSREQRAQRGGYISALRSPEILMGIKPASRGRIAVAYFEWATPDFQRVRMPWIVIDDPDDAAAFADAIEAQPIVSEWGTSISAGLLLATKLLATSALQGDRHSVDISGDGPISPAQITGRRALVRHTCERP